MKSTKNSSSENPLSLPKNREKDTNEARSELSQKTTDSESKKSLKRFLPFLAIILGISAVVSLCAVLSLGHESNPDYTLSDNIDDSSIDWSVATSSEIELTDSLKITSGGVYTLSGEISDGMIEIDTEKDVKLILNNVTVTNSNGPAIYVANADTIIIETADGTENTFTDSSTYTNWDEDVCATIFSHDDLVLQGSGTLIVNGNYADGIVGKDDLKVVSGTYKIDAKDDALRGRDSVYVVDGDFTLVSGGDSLKSNNSDESDKGWIKIDDGKFSISAGDDGVHAESTLEINGGSINVKKSYEGLEAARITINAGDISVVSSDDGLNAAGGNDSSSPNMMNYSSGSDYWIIINGGNISVNASGDGIDSNGSLTFNGGTVSVDGPSNSANGALDAEGSVVYNGGTIVAIGASGMAVAPNSTSSKNSLSIFFSSTYSSGTKLTVKDSSGNTIVEHTAIRSFGHASLSSEEFAIGETYTILINDSEYNTVTLSSTTTQVGSGGGMMPGGGEQQRQQENQNSANAQRR